MRKSCVGAMLAVLLISLQVSASVAGDTQYRRLPVAEYVDKMEAGWIGQMVGVGWGAPTEFKFKCEIIPENKVPLWKPEMVNQYSQDDIYVEMTFLRTLEVHGLDVPIQQAGIDFANSGYNLAHANKSGRSNLRMGIAPPDSGHPQFNPHPDDIDYQIEADYSGLIAPGMPNMCIELGEKFGRLMNYGDGMYGGQFVGAMYAEAFFEKDVVKIIEAGLKAIPSESLYAEMVRDMLEWHREAPDDWQKTWTLVQKKYYDNKDYFRVPCEKTLRRRGTGVSIDAKLNGAYILMGLLYGDGDIEKTTVISMRCGQDSDCNPSNAAGVLCTSIGASNLPDRFVSMLDRTKKFSHTEYNFPRMAEVCTKLAREIVLRQGGRIEENNVGEEIFVIPVVAAKPSALAKSWEPGPIADSRFTTSEMKQINPPTIPYISATQTGKWSDTSIWDVWSWKLDGTPDGRLPGSKDMWANIGDRDVVPMGVTVILDTDVDDKFHVRVYENSCLVIPAGRTFKIDGGFRPDRDNSMVRQTGGTLITPFLRIDDETCQYVLTGGSIKVESLQLTKGTLIMDNSSKLIDSISVAGDFRTGGGTTTNFVANQHGVTPVECSDIELEGTTGENLVVDITAYDYLKHGDLVLFVYTGSRKGKFDGGPDNSADQVATIGGDADLVYDDAGKKIKLTNFRH